MSLKIIHWNRKLYIIYRYIRKIEKDKITEKRVISQRHPKTFNKKSVRILNNIKVITF